MKATLCSLLLLISWSSICLADIELPVAIRTNLGIQSEPVRLVDAPNEWPAAATVLDAAPLIALLTELNAAEATAATSREEFGRVAALYDHETNVSRKTRDAARAQSITDTGKVTTVRSQLLAAWGPAIPRLAPPVRRQLADDLLAGRVSLVRAEPLRAANAAAAIRRVELADADNVHQWSAIVLGPLPQTTAAPFSGALLLQVPAALIVGQPLTASLVESAANKQEPSVPASAVIRWRSAEWVYEESFANHFTRRAVRTGARRADRVLIEEGLTPTARIVTVGARALLAAELSATDGIQEH